MAWVLKNNGEVLKSFPTRQQCVIEAYERKLVVQGPRDEVLVNTADIIEKPEIGDEEEAFSYEPWLGHDFP